MATTCSKKRIRTKAMAVERLSEHYYIFRTIHDDLAAHVGSEYGAFCERTRDAVGEAFDQIAPLKLD